MFEKSFPQSVTHILQKAFFKHALVKKYRFRTFALPVTSEFTMYIREQVISGALLTETRSMSYVDLAERALPSGLVAVRH